MPIRIRARKYWHWPNSFTALAQAILLGVDHFYQAHDVARAVGIFAGTALGAVWFGWLW